MPGAFTVWLISRIADMFLVLPDGSVLMLDVGGGTLARVADSRDDFAAKLDGPGNADDWLAVPLIDKCVAEGLMLAKGQCYGFVQPPVLGGDYTPENLRPIDLVDYVGAYGTLHEQIRDLPDGTEVVLRPS
ncbi:MAG TPA: DUF1851 domain-containing protein [Phycisphaerales bacterium]|nr:DUF1851 domain-containing protein [Phycisphaerales bacterium]